jgi:GntR family transcriptional regulator, transcriptional repressor for pyruvate dehydrogenase complex
LFRTPIQCRIVPPVVRASVPDLVFEQLRGAILSGRYGPGERLPTQRVLAAELDVNLASVRQAVARLEQLRLVEVRHGDAMRVLDWRSAGGLEALAALGATDVDIIGPLFEARRLLLVEAARLAAERRSDAQSESLCELASAFGEATDDAGALACDWQFMSAVIEATDNIVFQLIMNSVRRLYLPNATAFARVVADRAELTPLYTATAGAIRTRDGAGAARAIEELARAQEQRMVG